MRSKPMQSLRKGLLCHAFWSLCFDEEEEDNWTQKPEEQSTVVQSLQGTALEEWQLQQKREKRAWLGLSFSDDIDALRYNQKASTKKDKSSIAKTEQTTKDASGKPETIMISRLAAADKYIFADEVKYEMEDDVASEVSLDFTEPRKEIKGRRLQIKKKPPKVIEAKTTPSSKKKLSDSKSQSTNLTHEDTTATDSHSMLKPSEKSVVDSEMTDCKATATFSSAQEDTTFSNKSDQSLAKKETPAIESSHKGAEKPRGGKEDVERSIDSAEGIESPSKKKKSTRKTKDSKQMQAAATVHKASPVKTQDSEMIDDSSVLPNPRFIPDFSERELKLRAPDIAPETLRWRHAEESRWQFYGDPRQSRVDYWWKDKTRDTDLMQPHYAEARDPANDGECYFYDSDSDNESYFDKYCSGPSLASPEEAQKQARKLARECSSSNNNTKTRHFQLRRQNRYYTNDELDDFAEVQDLDRPRRRRCTFADSAGDAKNTAEQATTPPPKAKTRQPSTSITSDTFLKPVPPGVFQL